MADKISALFCVGLGGGAVKSTLLFEEARHVQHLIWRPSFGHVLIRELCIECHIRPGCFQLFVHASPMNFFLKKGLAYVLKS